MGGEPIDGNALFEAAMLDPEMRNELLSLSTPLLVDARVRLKLPESHLAPAIRPVVPFTRMAGTAVTVRLEVAEVDADLDLMIRAFESQAEGSNAIIVIEVPAALHADGIFGEGAATLARRHGFVGALIDGAVRDSCELRDMEFPAFSRTIAPGYIVGKCSATAVGEPISVGGRTIHAGDVIVGDNDGVVVIRPDELPDVLTRAQAIREWEQRMHRAIASGLGLRDAAEQAGPMP